MASEPSDLRVKKASPLSPLHPNGDRLDGWARTIASDPPKNLKNASPDLVIVDCQSSEQSGRSRLYELPFVIEMVLFGQSKPYAYTSMFVEARARFFGGGAVGTHYVHKAHPLHPVRRYCHSPPRLHPLTVIHL
jgi:hypothetical protein